MSIALWVGGIIALGIIWYWSTYWAFIIGYQAGCAKKTYQDLHNVAMDNAAMKLNPPMVLKNPKL